MKLSVVMPVYNEKEYILEILRRVQDIDIEKEVVVVDDFSTDGTREILRDLAACRKKNYDLPGGGKLRIDNIKFLFHEKNGGKGAALRTGYGAVTGDVIVVQDADLEYDPRDWHEMLRLFEEGWADVVYGSRFWGKSHRSLYLHHFLANKLISFLINTLCNTTFSDIEVCYKMFRREVLESLDLTADDFGIEVEFTVKMARQKKWRVYETGINYYGRSYEEGKKIDWRDGVKALWYILKYRFSS